MNPANIQVAIIHPGQRVNKMVVPLRASDLQLSIDPPDPYAHDIVIADNADTDLGKEVLKYKSHDAQLIYRMRGDIFHELDLWDMNPLKKWVARNIVLPAVDGALCITDRLAQKYQTQTNVSPVGVAGLAKIPSQWPTVNHTNTELQIVTLTNCNYWQKVKPTLDWVGVVDNLLADTGGEWKICGNGKYTHRVMKVLSDYENVTYGGYVDPHKTLANANLMIHATGLDAFPNSVLEGMASNLPVVTNDWVEFEAYDGPITVAKSETQLKEILRSYQAPEKRLADGRANREHIKTNHTPEVIGNQYERFCMAVMQDG